MRVCRTCGLPKPESEYYNTKNKPYYADCKECFNSKRVQKYRQTVQAGLCCLCRTEVARPKLKTCQTCGDHQKRYIQKRCRDVKKRAVEYFGGKCVRCGFRTHHLGVYDFHHLDPGDKEDRLSILFKKGLPWETLMLELTKCEMLCSNCHRIEHSED